MIRMMCKEMMEATQLTSLFFLLLMVWASFGFDILFAFLAFFSVSSEVQNGQKISASPEVLGILATCECWSVCVCVCVCVYVCMFVDLLPPFFIILFCLPCCLFVSFFPLTPLVPLLLFQISFYTCLSSVVIIMFPSFCVLINCFLLSFFHHHFPNNQDRLFLSSSFFCCPCFWFFCSMFIAVFNVVALSLSCLLQGCLCLWTYYWGQPNRRINKYTTSRNMRHKITGKNGRWY